MFSDKTKFGHGPKWTISITGLIIVIKFAGIIIEPIEKPILLMNTELRHNEENYDFNRMSVFAFNLLHLIDQTKIHTTMQQIL